MLSALCTWEHRKRDLLALIGLLQHCCQTLELAKPFLRRLIDRSCTVRALPHFVWLSTWERDDLGWWIQMLRAWNGKSLLLFPGQECMPDFSIASDAAGEQGFAAIFGRQCFAGA